MSQEISTGYRLSPQQKRLWLFQQHSRAYHTQCALLIEGELRREVLQEAAMTIVGRHEVLRTSFEYVPGLRLPLQVVKEETALAWRIIELKERDASDWHSALEDLARAEALQPFDFEHGPLVRFCLMAVSPDEHLLLVTLPSLCADKRTLNNLVSEIAQGYAASQEDVEMFDEAVPYVQFSEWQNELLEGEDGEAGREHWRKQGLNGLPIPRLPLEEEPADAARFETASCERLIEASLARKIELAATEHRVPISVWLLACWQTLLWRLSGQAELAIAVHYEGRVFEQLHEAFGLYERWPPVKCRLAGDFSFDEVLRQAQEAVQEAYEWQEYFSWDSLMTTASEGFDRSGQQQGSFNAGEAMGSHEGAWNSPVAFEYEQRAEAHSGGGLKFSVLRLYSCTERFKLKLSCAQQDDSISVNFHYDTGYYTRETVELLAERFETLLASTVREAPETRIGELEMLGERERQRLLVEWNNTRAAFNEEKCLHELFEEQATRTPERVALIDGDAQLSYAELNARANRLAHHLRGLGVGPEVLVAVCMERSLEMIVGVLGILKAGGAYVPLDPQHPVERLLFMLEEAEVAVLLTEQRLREGLMKGGAWQVLCLDAEWNQLAGRSEANPERIACPDNLAYEIYTSGSTGQPKGVMISHRSAANLVAGLRATVYDHQREPLRVSLNAPLAFDSSVKQVVQLMCGHTLEIVPQDVRADGPALWEFVRRRRLDVLDCTPSQLRLLLSAGWNDATEAWMPALALVGGEALDEATWNRMAAINGTRFYNVYGPTECTVDATACLVAEQAQKPSIGRPLMNTRTHILDEQLRPVPVGVAGELHIGGAGVGRGYQRQPALTAERFIPDPFGIEPGARLYRTGDMGRHLPDGRIEYLGRGDYQVKLRGHRIELGEIEATLLKHEAVGQAVVLVREDVPDDQRLVAYLVGKREAASGDGGLRGFLQQKLPEYMIPSAFVWLPEMPLTPNGKCDRRALPAPGEAGADDESDFAAARTPVEEVLAGIWAEVLRVERVGVNDNFFELGGHSLLATRVVSWVRKVFRIELLVRSIFETPTIAGLAESVERELKSHQGGPGQPIARVPRDRELRLSFAQRRLWFLHQFEPDNVAYNVPSAVRLKGRLDVRALEQTLSEIIRRHEVLRTTFTVSGGEPAQVINPAYPVSLPVVDLEQMGSAEREAHVRRLAKEDARRPFDLSRGPLLRAVLLRLEEDEYVLLFNLHHIVSDDWSKGVLLREVTPLYAAYTTGQQSPLSDLPIQYADFAEWQREWLQGEELETQLGYWKRHLARHRELLLPLDRPRPAAQTYDGAHLAISVPQTLTAELKSLSRREGATLFMTLLAAFKTLLSRYSRQDDIMIGAPIANRNREEVESLIGYFANTLVMRTDLAGNPTFRELLVRVREVALGAYAHQDVPMEMLVKELQPERDLNRTPLFQVVFTLQNAPMPPLELRGLALTPLPVEAGTSKFDLVVNLVDAKETVNGWIEYNTDLFDESTIRRMWEHLERLLASVVAHPDARLSELQILTEEEQLLLEKSVVVADLERSFSF